MIRLRNAVKHLLGRDLFIRREVAADFTFLGSHYGGWGLELGKLDKDSIVYSFGIGEDASFDLDLIRKTGCVVHGFDPTPKSLDWVRREIREERFRIHPWALSNEDGQLELWLPASPDHVSATLAPPAESGRESFRAEAFSLASILQKLGHDRVDVLKMDIEGAEYPVIESWCADGTIDRIGQLMVEFHHWIRPFHNDDTRRVLSLLRSRGFKTGWISDSGHEVLFVRR